MMQKNVSGQKWVVQAWHRTTGNPVAGDAANITAALRPANLGGAWGDADPLEDLHPQDLGGGYYAFDLTQAETNADHLLIIPVSATPDVIVMGAPPSLDTEAPRDGSGLTALGDTRIAHLDVDVGSRATLGAGAITWTYTLTEAGTGLPIADADIWITSDLVGEQVIASGQTNQSGAVTFHLDAGTIYVWRQKSGYNFTNPDTEVVS